MFYQHCLFSPLFMCLFIVFLLCCCVSAVPRLLWANGNEIGPHPGLPDHCFKYLPDRQHGHVHLGAREGPAGQTRQGQRLDSRTQRPVTVAAGTTRSQLTPSLTWLVCAGNVCVQILPVHSQSRVMHIAPLKRHLLALGVVPRNSQ